MRQALLCSQTDERLAELARRAVVRETLATMARLPERQREALLRIAVHGDSRDDVVDELGVSRTAALVHGTRTALRAAASALTPLPVLTRLAAPGTDAEPLSLRIGKLVAGAATAPSRSGSRRPDVAGCPHEWRGR
jgi:hypothetical protein